MRYLDHIRACNQITEGAFRPFLIGGEQLGWIRHDFYGQLARFPRWFEVDTHMISLSPDLETPDARSAALAAAVAEMAAEGIMPKPRGELYPVVSNWGAPELARIDRAAVPFFGFAAFGVHLNGYVQRKDGLALWIGRRAADRLVAPGKFDNLVAGGQPAGLSLVENLIKECAEEASIPENLARRAAPAGLVSYRLETEQGLKADTLFCYDLELPADFVPRAHDGEVEEFALWPVDRVMAEMRERGENFKFNVPLVILDFLIRRGVISADSEADYEALVKGLRGL